ncbi:MAG: hypothetical protein JWQ57_1676 [Mucilaginibacter sp.]|nr:hypothetical protein [Mucilaginibacter sp.]
MQCLARFIEEMILVWTIRSLWPFDSMFQVHFCNSNQHKYDLKCSAPNASKLDKQVIKLLYDPKMKPWLNRPQTVLIIREILNTNRGS